MHFLNEPSQEAIEAERDVLKILNEEEQLNRFLQILKECNENELALSYNPFYIAYLELWQTPSASKILYFGKLISRMKALNLTGLISPFISNLIHLKPRAAESVSVDASTNASSNTSKEVVQDTKETTFNWEAIFADGKKRLVDLIRARVEAQDKQFFDECGHILLKSATWLCIPEVVKLLLTDCGVKIDPKEEIQRPLLVSFAGQGFKALSDVSEINNLLLEFGANPLVYVEQNGGGTRSCLNPYSMQMSIAGRDNSNRNFFILALTGNLLSLLERGAGLLKPQFRIPFDELRLEPFIQTRPPGRTDRTQIPLGIIFQEKEIIFDLLSDVCVLLHESGSLKPNPIEFFRSLLTAEIVYKPWGSDHYLFLVKEFSNHVQGYHNLPLQEQECLQQMWRNMQALTLMQKQGLAEGIVQVLESVFNAEAQNCLQVSQQLARCGNDMSPSVRAIIFSFLNKKEFFDEGSRLEGGSRPCPSQN